MVLPLVIILALAFFLILVYRLLFGQRFISVPDLDGDFITCGFNLDGVDRKYGYFLPSKTGGDISILFVLHGAADTGRVIRKRLGYEFDLLSQHENRVVVYPDGYGKNWNDCRAAAGYRTKILGIDDLKFLKKVQKEIEERHGFSAKVVCFFGFSNGGHMVNRICMESPEWVSAAVVVAANLPVTSDLDCKPKDHPVPYLFLSGTADKTNPFEGGLVNVLNIKKLGHVMSSDETVDYWRELAGCAESQQIRFESRDKGNTRIEKRTWKKKGREMVVQYIVHGGGHTIPHVNITLPRILGATNHDITFVRETQEFFNKALQ